MLCACAVSDWRCSICGFVMRVIIMGGCFLCNDLLREHDLGGGVPDSGTHGRRVRDDSGTHGYRVEIDHPPHPSYHILETPGGIDRMHEVEIPTEEYYSALRKSMGEKHPRHVLFCLTICWGWKLWLTF